MEVISNLPKGHAELADLLPERIAVQPQKVGGLDLVATRGGERRQNQRIRYREPA